MNLPAAGLPDPANAQYGDIDPVRAVRPRQGADVYSVEIIDSAGTEAAVAVPTGLAALDLTLRAQRVGLSASVVDARTGRTLSLEDLWHDARTEAQRDSASADHLLACERAGRQAGRAALN
jgi:hypothetical protein